MMGARPCTSRARRAHEPVALERGTAVNQAKDDGCTPLLTACQNTTPMPVAKIQRSDRVLSPHLQGPDCVHQYVLRP